MVCQTYGPILNPSKELCCHGDDLSVHISIKKESDGGHDNVTGQVKGRTSDCFSSLAFPAKIAVSNGNKADETA